MLKKGRLLHEINGDTFVIHEDSEVVILHEAESNLWIDGYFYVVMDLATEESASVSKSYIEVL